MTSQFEILLRWRRPALDRERTAAYLLEAFTVMRRGGLYGGPWYLPDGDPRPQRSKALVEDVRGIQASLQDLGDPSSQTEALGFAFSAWSGDESGQVVRCNSHLGGTPAVWFETFRFWGGSRLLNEEARAAVNDTLNALLLVFDPHEAFASVSDEGFDMFPVGAGAPTAWLSYYRGPQAADVAGIRATPVHNGFLYEVTGDQASAGPEELCQLLSPLHAHRESVIRTD